MGLISSLSSVLGISETSTPVTAALSALDPETGFELIAESLDDGDSDVINAAGFQAFQYFPETISDSKSPEWSRNSVPGGSHPILSFINGGERVISFPAVFTQDENPEVQSLFSQLLTGTFEVSLGSLFGGDRKDTVDIAAAIAWLREFTYPEYKNNISKAPPFAIVYLPNSGIIGGGQFLDSIVGAMVQCDVTYEKFHRNGSPRVSVVQLSFVETVQTGENWKFVGAKDVREQLELGGNFDSESGRSPYKREVIGADQGGGFF